MNTSREAALSLLDKARGDQRAYHALIADQKMPMWLVGFHAQQAVEKAMKSVLASASVEYPRTHNLSMLAALLKKNSLTLPPNVDELSVLTPFGVASRYDISLKSDDSLALDRERIALCIDRIIIWAETCLSDISPP
jgi:HEPN domain-containing protein